MVFNFFKKAAAGFPGTGNEYSIELAKAGMAGGKAGSPKALPEAQLTLDISQTPNDIIIESAIAGVRPEDIDINVVDDSVSIKGARHRDQLETDREYLFQECYWGRFARSIILPEAVDPESAEVTLRNGILRIRLPKLSQKKMKKLKVRMD